MTQRGDIVPTKRYQTKLDKVGHKFAQIDPNDFKACQDFIKQEPSILLAGYAAQFWTEAVHVLSENNRLERPDPNLALQSRICVSRYVLLTQYENSTKEDRKTLLSRLVRRDNKTTNVFYTAFDQAMSTAETRTQVKVAPTQHNASIRDRSPLQSKEKAAVSRSTAPAQIQPRTSQPIHVKADSRPLPSATSQYEPSSFKNWQASVSTERDPVEENPIDDFGSAAPPSGQLYAQGVFDVEHNPFINVDNDYNKFDAAAAYMRAPQPSDSALKRIDKDSSGTAGKQRQYAAVAGQYSSRGLEKKPEDRHAKRPVDSGAYPDSYSNTEPRKLGNIPETQENLSGVPSAEFASRQTKIEATALVQRPRRGSSNSGKRPTYQSPSYSRPHQARSKWSLSGDGNIDIRGTDSSMKTLDPKYELKYEKTFFVVGRVFSFVRHENASDQSLAKREYDNWSKPHSCPYSLGPFDVWIYTCVRRVVVVRQKQGYCWCIPILTYKGRGLTKSGLKDHKEHAIVYGAGSGIYVHPNEPELDFDPIEVELARNQQLEPMSRLHFGKPHTIESNVKVMNIGIITGESLNKLKAYWDDTAKPRKAGGSVLDYENL